MPKYAARTDSNQFAIATELWQAGFTVINLSRVGDNCPDLLVVGYSNLSWRVEALLVEVKTETGKLSPGQQQFFDEFPEGGPLILARCTEDVLAWFGVIQT